MADVKHKTDYDIGVTYAMGNIADNIGDYTVSSAQAVNDLFYRFNSSLEFLGGGSVYKTSNGEFNNITGFSGTDRFVRIFCAFRFKTIPPSDDTYGLWSAYTDANNYIQCWAVVSSPTLTLRLKHVSGGVTLCDISVSPPGGYGLNNEDWVEVEIFIQLTTGSPNDYEYKLVVNGNSSTKTTTTNASSSLLTIIENVHLGLYIDPSGPTNYYFEGYIGEFFSEVPQHYDIDDTLDWVNSTQITTVSWAGVDQYFKELDTYFVFSRLKEKTYPVSNIPDWAHAENICLITGTSPNQIAFAFGPNSSSLDFDVSDPGSGTAFFAQRYFIALTFYDSRTGRESHVSDFKSLDLTTARNIRITFNSVSETYKNYYDTIRAYYIRGSGTGKVDTFMASISLATVIAGLPYAWTVSSNAGYPFSNPVYPVARELQIEPPNLTLSLVAGILSATYDYAMTIYDPFTGQESKADTGQISPATNNVSVSSATTLPYGCVFRVYRKLSTAGVYEYIFDIYDNLAIIDNGTYTPNSAITKNLTEGTPPRSDFVTRHGDRVYYATLDAVWYSQPLLPTQVRDANYFVPGDPGDQITGLEGDFLNLLCVFKEKKLWAYRSLDPTIFEPFLASEIYGCGAHRTIRRIKNLLFFANRFGVYIFDGAVVVKISEDIDDLFGSVITVDFQKASAAVNEKDGQYELLIPGYKRLSFDYEGYIKDKIMRWTELTVGDLDQVIEARLPNYYKTRLNQDVTSYVAYLEKDDVADDFYVGWFGGLEGINDGSNAGVDWYWKSVPLTIKLFNANHLKQLHCNIDTDVDDQTIKLGYDINGSENMSTFTLKTTYDQLGKKIGVRSRFMGINIQGVGTKANIFVSSFSLFGETLGYR
jgi:hypothetical protein